MTTLIRTWLGLAALGAGLVHLALAASAPPGVILVLVVIGGAEVVWGVFALAGRRVPLPRIALGGAVVALAGWAALLLVSAGDMSDMAGVRVAGVGSGLPALPMLGAAALDLACAVALAVVLRRGDRGEAGEPRLWSYLAGVTAGAAVVAGVTSVSLGATAVGAIGMPGM